MDKHEFETHYREQVRDILNQLQSAMMVSSRLEDSLSEIGRSIQDLTQTVELFLTKDETGEDDSPSAF